MKTSFLAAGLEGLGRAVDFSTHIFDSCVVAGGGGHPEMLRTLLSEKSGRSPNGVIMPLLSCWNRSWREDIFSTVGSSLVEASALFSLFTETCNIWGVF